MMNNFVIGSLAGLEELAAKGSMAPNGSMPSVNIGGFNSMYINPLDASKRRRQQLQQLQQQEQLLLAQQMNPKVNLLSKLER